MLIRIFVISKPFLFSFTAAGLYPVFHAALILYKMWLISALTAEKLLESTEPETKKQKSIPTFSIALLLKFKCLKICE